MTAAFHIGSRRVGEGAPALLVAELSANHGGSCDRALRTIEAAASAGADAIKVQTYTPDTLTLRSALPRFLVRSKNAWRDRTLHDLYSEAMTPWEWHAALKDAVEAAGLIFFSTPFDPTATEFLASLGVGAYKIASFEIIDLPLIEQTARHGKPMILSTGMATLQEITAAIATCRGVGNDQIALLHCVSAYPARAEAMHLKNIAALKSLGVVVGLADHTPDPTVAIGAVALGAKVIEKHFILDRKAGGPDGFFSLEPDEFRGMTRAIRQTEAALGPPRFGPSIDEGDSAIFRRSLSVARQTPSGAILTCDDIRSVRPSGGLDPRHLPSVLGRPALRELEPGVPLTWDAVGERSPDARYRLSTAAAKDHAPHEELATWLSSPRPEDRLVLTASFEGTPIGWVRLDPSGHGTLEVSLSIRGEHRAHDHATGLLWATEVLARSQGAVTLVATGRKEDEEAIRAFKNAGYYSFVERAAPSGAQIRCERRIVPFPSS